MWYMGIHFFPQHLNRQKMDLMKFDYIVSNPPFNVDFSDNRDAAGDILYERFWQECQIFLIRKKIA